MMPGKTHLTALDILIELRGWLEDNSQQQANGYPLTQADCVEAIDALLHRLRH